MKRMLRENWKMIVGTAVMTAMVMGAGWGLGTMYFHHNEQHYHSERNDLIIKNVLMKIEKRLDELENKVGIPPE